MAGQRLIYGGPSSGGGGGSVLSNSVLLQNQRAHPPPPSSNKPLDSFFLSGSSSSSFLGTPSMVSFEEGKNGSRRPFFQLYDQEENGDDEYDEYFQQPEKKRRLKAEQVQFLEKSFETENKLEPDRKVQLAKELGLQPRQIAIWFQNRRARWKTKQLEKDFEVLQDSYNKLKANYDNLLKEKEKLKAEVHDLTDKLQLQGEKGNSESSDTKSPPEALEPDDIADFAYREEDLSKEISNEEGKHNDDNIVVTSDVLDSESPHYTDGAHSSLIEPADSPFGFDQELSDASQDEEDNFSMMFLPPLAGCMFPKLESADNPCLPSNSAYFGFPISSYDNHSYDFWS